jgi:uncharacterized protein (TIGR02996 family)
VLRNRVARAKQPAPEPPRYVRHKTMPVWGAGVLVAVGHGQRTYLFADGGRRTFKEDVIERFFEASAAPDDDVQLKLARGVKSVAMPKAVNIDLEAQIKAAPDDEDAFMVYGDWLQEQGDPRGDLVAVQRHLERAPKDKQVKKTEAELFEKHGKYLVPPLLWKLANAPVRKSAARSEIVWRAGFIDRVRIARATEPKEDEPGVQAVVRELLNHPSAVFLRGITIGSLGAKKATEYRPIVSEIAKAQPSVLEELELGDMSALEIAGAVVGDASEILSACPRLRRLVVRAGTLRFDRTPKHANLRELVVHTTGLTPRSCSYLLGSVMPELETFELTIPQARFDEDALARLGNAKGMPKLAKLAVRESASAVAIVNALASGALLPRLTDLDLSGSEIDPATRIKLARSAEFQHVRVELGSGPSVPTTTSALDPKQILSRTRDAALATAARRIAASNKGWLAMGRDGNRLWAEYEGSDFYYVMAELDSRRTGCSCPSAKHPCKHSLALLLVATQRMIPEAKIPDAVVRNTQSRTSWFESRG